MVTVDKSLLPLGVFGGSSFPVVGCDGGGWSWLDRDVPADVWDPLRP